MSRRPGVDDAPRAAVEQRRLASARVDELRAVYHPGATERLRLRLVAELGRVHEARLRSRDLEGARSVRDEMRRVVFEHGEATRLLPTPSRIVQEQGLLLAEAMVDAQRAATRAHNFTEVDALFLDLARLRRFAPDDAQMDEAWCGAVAWAHEAALATGRFAVARRRLDELRQLAPAVGEPGRGALARALSTAHGGARTSGRVELADALLAELRAIAARAHASTEQRGAFCSALRCAHAHAGAGRASALIGELSHWANRPTATEQMRRDHAGAVGEGNADERDRHAPLSTLRSRAYRSEATTDDTELLFRRLESLLEEDAHAFETWATYFTELRRLAQRADAPASLRLRFARRWLAHRSDVRQRGAADNDRAAYLWAVAAAHRGDPDGQLLVGHCYRQGRGAAHNDRRARQWYLRAAAVGSSEAEFWIRYTQPRERWLVYRGPWLTVAGFVLLGVYALTTGAPSVSALGIALYLLLQVSVQLIARAILFRPRTGASGEDAWSSGRLIAFLRRRPWRLFMAAAEDGLILVPILWLGVSPWTALVAGIAFGFLHYPTFGWRSCVAKGIDYFVTALLFLPVFGLWTVAAGHVVFDALVVLLAARASSRR